MTSKRLDLGINTTQNCRSTADFLSRLRSWSPASPFSPPPPPNQRTLLQLILLSQPPTTSSSSPSPPGFSCPLFDFALTKSSALFFFGRGRDRGLGGRSGGRVVPRLRTTPTASKSTATATLPPPRVVAAT